MDFKIKKGVSVIGYTNPNGKHGYYPTYHIDIDGSDIADEFNRYNLAPEDVAFAIERSCDEMSEAIARIVTRNLTEGAKSPTYVRVHASVDLQRWVNNYAVDVDTEEFDCEIALDEFPLNVLPSEADGFSEGACDYGDDIWFEAVDLCIVDEWGGPFRFYIDDYAAYDRYIAARVRDEYGYELRG